MTVAAVVPASVALFATPPFDDVHDTLYAVMVEALFAGVANDTFNDPVVVVVDVETALAGLGAFGAPAITAVVVTDGPRPTAFLGWMRNV